MTIQRDIESSGALNDAWSVTADHGGGPVERDANGGNDESRVPRHWVGPAVVVSVSGAVDMLSASGLSEAIATPAATAATALIVDLSEVEFLACAGMSVLIAAHARLTPAVQFAVVADGAATSRPLTLMGIDTTIALYRTLDDALRALTDA